MLEIREPTPIELPDKYTVTISPGETVSVGSNVCVVVKYEKGDYERHEPILEISSAPGRDYDNPRRWGELISKGDSPTFVFKAEDVGVYVLRLRPFGQIPSGQLIEIHSIGESEKINLELIFRRFKTSLGL